MVETLPKNEIRQIKSNYILHNVQERMVSGESRGYTDFSGNRHEGFYLYAQEIISAMNTLILAGGYAKTIEAAQTIIDNGWLPLHGADRVSTDNRNGALNILSKLCNVQKANLTKGYRTDIIGEDEFRSRVEPILGISMGILYESEPNRFDAIVRSSRRKSVMAKEGVVYAHRQRFDK